MAKKKAAKRAAPKKKKPTTALARRRPRAPAARPPAQAPASLTPTTSHELQSQPAFSLAAEGLSRLRLSPAQKKTLRARFPPEKVALLPGGEIYIPNTFVRERLNEVAGPGAWGLDPRSTRLYDDERGLFLQSYALLIDGFAVGIATGEQAWRPTNPRMTRGDAVEGAKSNALTRICKDLGIGHECHDRRYAYRFRLDHGVLVYYIDRGKKTTGWRHVDDPPLPGESDIVDESPNQDRYTRPAAPQRAASQPSRRRSPDDPIPTAPRTPEVTNPDAPVSGAWIGQLERTMDTHGVKLEDVHAFIKKAYGHTSRKQILRSQANAVVEWVKAPHDAFDDDPVEGEVIDG